MTNNLRKTKLITLALGCIAICMAILLGVTFSGSTAYALEIDTSTPDNITDTGGTYAYSATDKTLMLNGYNGGEIRFDGENDVTVKLEKGTTNTITLNDSTVTENRYGVYAAGNLTVTGNGTLDINMDISGAGDEITTEYGKALYGLYAKNLTINGEINVNVNLTSNGFSCGMFATKDITVADKANVDIKCRSKYKNTDFYRAKIAVNGYATPSATFKGVTITKSKIYISTSGFARVEDISYVAGIKIYNAELSIFDSDVYIESRSCISGNGEPTNLVFIKGASVVRLINPHENNRYVMNAYVSTFDLSKGGSVTINASGYNFYGIYDVKLVEGTKAEYGTKGSQSTRDSDAYYYEAEFHDDLKIIRFVYGAGAGTATTSDVKVEGMKGYAIDESEFTVTLAGDTFTEIAQNTDVTSWFKNMPLGLSAKIKNKVEAGATSLTVAISGTPESVETVRAYIEIPEKYLVTGEYDITIDPNKNNVDFSIVSGETIAAPVPSVTQFVYDGEAKVLLTVTGDEGYTVSNNKNTFAGEYTAVVTLKKGYKWSDGTTDPINIAWVIKRQDVTIEVTLTKTTYECTGYTIEPEYKVYRVTPDGNVELPRSEYKGELTKNKDVGTATLTVKDNEIGNYNITNIVTVDFEIIKGTKTPPAGLTGVAPSADGARDGKITGTTDEMEYSTDTAFTSPIPCTDGETIGLAEGTYYVRYKETGTSKPSDYAVVKVALNSVTVIGGTGGGKYAAKKSVTVKATVPTGKTFASWSFTGVVLSSAQLTQEEMTFEMPDNDVTLKATFEDIIYSITVTNGTASAPTAKYQEQVTVKANAPATGKEFDKWVVSGITLSDEDSAKATLSFKMPASDVTIEATYKDALYRITVTNGTASATTAKYQTEVTVTANAPDSDTSFDKWEVTGLDTTGMDLSKTEIKFQMPAGDVTFKATYVKDEESAASFEIKVEGGTGAGTFNKGKSITITANEPAEGKKFAGWKDESGVIVSTEKEYTFKVTGATTFTAVYEDMSSGGGEITPPAEKDGLSGGAIAGIVIGSAAVAGLGGFAIFWFVIKKKSFADLIAAIKGIFKKKQ